MKSRMHRIRTYLFLILLGITCMATTQAQEVQVNSANPTSAEQGTLDLDVEISGRGFDNSAVVEFFPTGTSVPGGINVKKVKVRGSKKIIATIDVDSEAVVDDFDIEISLSSGRRGRGSTLFSVKKKPTGKPSNEYTANDGVVFISPSDIAGFDYHIIGTADRDDIRAGSGRDLIESGGTRDEIFGLGNDDEIHGGDGSDVIDAGDGNDLVFGDAGGDWLRGSAGTDYLLGGADEDYLYFSLGQFNGTGHDVDIYDGGDGSDYIVFQDATSATVDLATASYQATINDPSFGLSTVSGTFVNIENSWGSAGDDVLHGTSAGETMYGDDGNDLINGLDGDDYIDGGRGDDDLYGGPGNDFMRGDGAVGGNDRMFGEDGNDILESRGDEANDEMHGGSGCDRFVFLRRFGEDTIVDFEEGCEQIDLSWFNPKYRADFNDLDISESGSDILIDFWFTKQGGVGGTIVLKDGVTNGVSVDPSDIIF